MDVFAQTKDYSFVVILDDVSIGIADAYSDGRVMLIFGRPWMCFVSGYCATFLPCEIAILYLLSMIIVPVHLGIPFPCVCIAEGNFFLIL